MFHWHSVVIDWLVLLLFDLFDTAGPVVFHSYCVALADGKYARSAIDIYRTRNDGGNGFFRPLNVEPEWDVEGLAKELLEVDEPAAVRRRIPTAVVLGDVDDGKTTSPQL